jgi:hypothetical protein
VTMSDEIRRPPAVWLGDAVRASRQLRADPGVVARVLELLGLQSSIAQASQSSIGDGPALQPRELPPVHRPPGEPPAETVRQATLRQPPPELEAPDGPIVEHAPPDSARASTAPRHLPTIAQVLPTPSAGPPLRRDSLLPAGQHRAILAALCRSPAATGDIDIDTLVERIARREPVQTLPPAVAPTTRRGVQVLVDFGDGMRPFIGDQEEVVEELERIAGQDGFEILRFACTPLDEPGAGPGPVWTWRAYRPPLAGQPVVVLSDLGAGAEPLLRRDVQRRWSVFAARLHTAGNQVAALAPVPIDRLPRELRAALPVLTWDRTARVADAVEAVQRQVRRRGRGLR